MSTPNVLFAERPLSPNPTPFYPTVEVCRENSTFHQQELEVEPLLVYQVLGPLVLEIQEVLEHP